MNEGTAYRTSPFYERPLAGRRYDFLLISASCFTAICFTILHAANVGW